MEILSGTFEGVSTGTPIAMIIFNTNQNRFSFLLLIIGIFVTISFISRTILLLTDFIEVDIGFISLLKVYGVGLLYDLVASFYYIIPLVIYLVFIPNKLFNTKIHKLIFLTTFFAAMYLLIFNAVSEWFFWEEFGKRFNFIAVDYLVYTQEVIHNILEFYPILSLLVLFFIISYCLFYLIYKNVINIYIIFYSEFISVFK